MKEIYKPSDLARASLMCLAHTKQFPYETVTQSRSRIQCMAGKAYPRLTGKGREPVMVSLFASGLVYFRLAEHVLTQARHPLRETERIALEVLQIASGFNSLRPRIRLKEHMPSLRRQQAQGRNLSPRRRADSEVSPPDLFEIDTRD